MELRAGIANYAGEIVDVEKVEVSGADEQAIADIGVDEIVAVALARRPNGGA